MVGVRNIDQVLFLQPRETGGVRKSRILGRQDDYSILREGHGPGYSPTDRGLIYPRTPAKWRRPWLQP